ncbi:MAG: hypothetical protein K2Q18_01095, partial [Bdellovibrionales bacterium]|nr:hypothetical protein [Bdellovibrionales bacterium]
MRKTFTPDINLYSEILPFFQDFYLLNKEKNKNFSYQYMAMQLDWSAPYINDVFKGRKKLSLNRAMELIEYLGLSGTTAERFLFLYLSDSDPSFSNSSMSKTATIYNNSTLPVA